MRDPKRIPEILDLVRDIWLKRPDLRLTQLILNVGLESDIYYMEDEVLINRLKRVYEEN